LKLHQERAEYSARQSVQTQQTHTRFNKKYKGICTEGYFCSKFYILLWQLMTVALHMNVECVICFMLSFQANAYLTEIEIQW